MREVSSELTSKTMHIASYANRSLLADLENRKTVAFGCLRFLEQEDMSSTIVFYPICIFEVYTNEGVMGFGL